MPQCVTVLQMNATSNDRCRLYVLGVPPHFHTEYRHEAAVGSPEHRMKWVVLLGDGYGYQWTLPWECNSEYANLKYTCLWNESTVTVLQMDKIIKVLFWICQALQLRQVLLLLENKEERITSYRKQIYSNIMNSASRKKQTVTKHIWGKTTDITKNKDAKD